MVVLMPLRYHRRRHSSAGSVQLSASSYRSHKGAFGAATKLTKTRNLLFVFVFFVPACAAAFVAFVFYQSR